ncbi:PQQ-like beta-propeller repeat protein [Botrimarina mediterranea]|uniref:Outer membrane biogenesis protein BamB n=1 Tax=Botrimarina mediterranea TaxID=2528022 RepID=A0A518K593_9BACT|nr:PQQ-like beta-propeller repeat protein [Botrimarina mediterranea]QDV72956.1 outer membrane biogenesis protein BamB [Botrimarina mediterranea]QDV77530.1 outer membrane biogenesis protein BamB [Planctomycetes bacterium K2D]
MVSKKRFASRFPCSARAFCAGLAAYAVFSGIFVAEGAETPAETDPAAFSRLYFGLQPPVDREKERRVELTEELLKSGRFGEAAPLVAEQLADETDHLGSDGESLKRRLLGAVMRAGPSDLAVLRSVLQGEYRRAAEGATSTHDWRRIVAGYPPELFGVASLEALARAETDAGSYASAAVALRRAALLSRLEGDREKAQQLAAAETVSRLRLGERGAIEQPADERAAEWIDATAGEAAAIAARSAPQAWLSAGGDAKRLATAPGEPPAPWRNWRALVGDEEDLDDESEGDLLGARHETVAVGGVIVTDAKDRLVAFSAQTGRRLWEVLYPIDPLAWRNVETARGVSTDTRLVFAVTPSSSSEFDRNALLRRRFGDTLFSGDDPPLPANCLAAYEIASSGKLRWRIDGADANGVAPGTRFLGAPAIVDGRLYVLAESEQVVRLIEADAETGAVLWSQPLVQCQRPPAAQATAIAVSPTLGDELVYCPTGRGAVAAVDPLRRRLEWVRYLAIDEEDARPTQQMGWGAFRDPETWADGAAGWRHCRMVEHEGRLLVASPALPSLQAFDSATGELVWRQETPDAVLLGGVIDGAALAVESSRVSAWRVADGERLWRVNLPNDEAPAGEPLMVGGSLVLPLSSGGLATLDIGNVESKPEWRVENLDLNPLVEAPRLGNLLYHGEAILSRSVTTLESFPQPASMSALEQRVVDDLASGEAALPTLDDLRDAVRSRPDDRRLAELYAVALVRTAADDAAAAEAAGEELSQLVAGRRAAAYAATLRMNAALARGDSHAAFAEAEGIAAGRAGRVLLQPETGLHVVASRLAANSAAQAGASSEMVARLAGTSGTAPSVTAPPSDTQPVTNSPWTKFQVAAAIEAEPVTTTRGRGGMRMRQDRSSRTRSVSFVGERRGDLRWLYESRGGDWRLVATSGRGERVFAEAIPGEPWSPGPDTIGAVGAPGGRSWRDSESGDWLALKIDSGYFTCHVDRGIVWETVNQSPSDWPAAIGAFDQSEAPVAIGPWGVISVAGSSLRCRNLATGELVWRRDAASLGGSLRALTVGDEVFVVGNEREGVRLSAWSGQQRGVWRPPTPQRWRGVAGDKLLVEERAAGKRRLRIVPVASDESTDAVWEMAVDLKTRFLLHDGAAVFFDEDRQLTVVDIATAKQRWQTKLVSEESSLVRSVRLHERGGWLLVEVDRSNPVVDRVRGALPVGDDPLLTGELHCLDPRTGESPWGGPVIVDGMALVETAASDAPLVLLARKRAAEAGSEPSEAQIALTLLDLTTGATVFRNHVIPVGDEQEGDSALWAVYERGERESLLVRAGRAWVTLETTDLPAPPRPRMVASVEDPEASRLNGPDDIGRGVERLFNSFWEGDDD